MQVYLNSERSHCLDEGLGDHGWCALLVAATQEEQGLGLN